jgi:DNA repair protein SbcD/Mre11
VLDLKSVKFIHCADIHLDAPLTSLGGDGRRSSLRRQDLKAVFGEIIRKAAVEKVELLLISGDLYEHECVKKSTIHFINDLFASIPDTHVLITPGNHDPFTLGSYYRNFPWSSNVHILTSENPAVLLEELGVYVQGAGFSGFYEEGVFQDRILPARTDCINILVAHCTLDLAMGSKAYNPVRSEYLSALNMDYIALGHFHTRIEGAGARKNIFNPGSPEPLGFDEPGEHGVFQGAFGREEQGTVSLAVEFVRLNKRQYRSIAADITGCFTNEAVLQRVRDMTGAELGENWLYYIALTGYIDKDFRVDPTQLQMALGEHFFYCRLVNNAAPDYNFEEIAREPGLRGLFTRKMLARIRAAQEEQKKELLIRAVYYGLEALDEGRVSVS